MATQLTSIEDVIKELGGVQAVASKYGRGVNAVGMWKARDRFPSELYLVMQADLKALRAAAPARLWGMAEPATARSA